MNPALFWLAAIIFFSILEASTLGLTSIWFALGSIVAMICALLNVPVYMQVIAFIICSGVLLAFTRPFARKYLNIGKHKTNLDRVVGEYGKVIEAIDNDNGTGQVKVMGQVWTARSVDGGNIDVGTEVLVHEISGVKVMVSKAGSETIIYHDENIGG